MEVLSQVQNMVVENAFIVGVGLLLAVIIAGITWYWFSRTRGESNKSSVLENQARVNSADLDATNDGPVLDAPSSALATEPHEQVNQQVEMATE